VTSLVFLWRHIYSLDVTCILVTSRFYCSNEIICILRTSQVFYDVTCIFVTSRVYCVFTCNNGIICIIMTSHVFLWHHLYSCDVTCIQWRHKYSKTSHVFLCLHLQCSDMLCILVTSLVFLWRHMFIICLMLDDAMNICDHCQWLTPDTSGWSPTQQPIPLSVPDKTSIK